MRRQRAIGAFLILLGSVVMLGAAPPMQAAPAFNLKLAFASVPQIPYVADMIAARDLGKRGYNIESVFFPNGNLLVQAMLKDEVQIGQFNPIAAATAIDAGADLMMLMQSLRSHWVLVAPASIASPAQLSGRRIAIHSEKSMSSTVVNVAIEKWRIKNPHILIIPGSPARAQALQSGQVDATSLFLSDAVRLSLQVPGRFHIIADFTDLEVPDAVIVVRQSWAQRVPKALRIILAAILEAHRHVNRDPAYTINQTFELFPQEDKRFADQVVREYIKRQVWVNDGGDFTPAAVARMITFLVEVTHDLPPTATRDPARYADFTPLQDVLREIGR